MFFSFCYDLPVVVVFYFMGRLREKEGCVRGQCDRDEAETVFISCAHLSQRIDIWRGRILGAVGADVIGSLRIQRNKDEIEILFGFLTAKKTKEQYGTGK